MRVSPKALDTPQPACHYITTARHLQADPAIGCEDADLRVIPYHAPGSYRPRAAGSDAEGRTGGERPRLPGARSSRTAAR